MSDLADKKCIPCTGGVPPLPSSEVHKLLARLSPGWELTHVGTRLFRTFKFKDFKAPMELAIAIGKLAEEQWHHPELHVGWGHLEVEIWTHKIGALVESDFILAAKIDRLTK